MKIQVKKPSGARLLTGGKLCPEDIEVTPVLQSKTVMNNGTVRADEGYAGLDAVVVAVPVPDGYVKPVGTVTITENGTHEVSGYASAEVNVPSEEPVLQTKNITVIANGTHEHTPDNGYDGIYKVNLHVNVPTETVEDYDGTIIVA